MSASSMTGQMFHAVIDKVCEDVEKKGDACYAPDSVAKNAYLNGMAAALQAMRLYAPPLERVG